MTIGVAVPMYNAGLCIYYLLTIRYSVREDVMAKRYKPWLLCIPALFVLSTGLLTASFQLYNVADENTGGCFIAYSPYGCEDDNELECTRGKPLRISTDMLFTLFVTMPFVLSLVIVVVTNMAIFLVIRHRMKPIADRSRQFNRSLSDDLDQRIRDVAYQCFWYVAAFLTTYFAAAISQVQATEETRLEYVGLVLQQIFMPMQGLFNFLVYLRPRYIQARRGTEVPSVNREGIPTGSSNDVDRLVSRRSALRKAIFGDNSVADPEVMLQHERHNIDRQTMVEQSEQAMCIEGQQMVDRETAGSVVGGDKSPVSLEHHGNTPQH